MASLVAQMGGSPGLPMQETGDTDSILAEDPLEKEIEPTSIFLPEKAHGQRRLVGNM